MKPQLVLPHNNLYVPAKLTSGEFGISDDAWFLEKLSAQTIDLRVVGEPITMSETLTCKPIIAGRGIWGNKQYSYAPVRKVLAKVLHDTINKCQTPYFTIKVKHPFNTRLQTENGAMQNIDPYDTQVIPFEYEITYLDVVV
jgi:hypothetical protein